LPAKPAGYAEMAIVAVQQYYQKTRIRARLESAAQISTMSYCSWL
jgi:hypothetical protein